MEDENKKTYTLEIKYSSDERDSESIEGLSKESVKHIANSLQIQLEAKKEYATVEIEKNDFYYFRLIDIKGVYSIEVDEE